MYLIDGPEKCLLVDTSFGVGDLKGLIHHLVGDKEIIVCNTHAHFDHCYGNAQFDKIYCHEYEVRDMKLKNDPNIWNYLFNNTGEDMIVWDEVIKPGEPIYTKFDKKDIIIDLDHKETYKPYEIVGIPDGYTFDLGQGYIVEAVLIPGHTPGQCGYYDHQTHCLISGDTTGTSPREKGTPYAENSTVEAMHDALVKLQPRFKEISGVFPGHGAWDVSPLCLQYLLDALDKILEDPNNYDSKKVFERNGKKVVSLTKNIYQWTAVRYTLDNVYKHQLK